MEELLDSEKKSSKSNLIFWLTLTLSFGVLVFWNVYHYFSILMAWDVLIPKGNSHLLYNYSVILVVVSLLTILNFLAFVIFSILKRKTQLFLWTSIGIIVFIVLRFIWWEYGAEPIGIQGGYFE